jgi:hypothetical protein
LKNSGQFIPTEMLSLMLNGLKLQNEKILVAIMNSVEKGG